MIGRRTRNRDIALTTLIDLLVQVVFVFTLILIASEAIGGPPGERGWVAPETWKTLISIFDVDPDRVRTTDEQAEGIKKKYNELTADLESTKRDLGQYRSRVAELEKKMAELEKLTGRGPGYPVCRDKDKKEIAVINAVIDSDGKITVSPLEEAGELRIEKPLNEGAFLTALSAESFTTAFLPWREYGLGRDPRCAYKAFLSYDPRAEAGKYEPARRAIARYFSLAGAPKQLAP